MLKNKIARFIILGVLVLLGIFIMAMSMGSFASRVVATKVVATDGTGDFTDIQTAIDALPVAGGVVYIKEGTYVITVTITLNDNVALIGAGYSTKLDIDEPTGQGSGIYLNNVSNCYITDLRIDLTNAADRIGIEMSSADHCIIQNIWIDECTDSYIYLSNCTNNRISGLIVTSGFSVWEGSSNNIFVDCICDDATGPRIRADSDQNLVAGCIIKNNVALGAIGVEIGDANCDENLIHGNIFDNNTDNIIDSGTGTLAADNILS